MKIFTIADLTSNWYPHQAFQQFQKHSPVQFVSHPDQANLIWIMSYYLAPAGLLTFPPAIYKFLPVTAHRKKTLRKKPIITTIHHLTPAKKPLWLPAIRLLDSITDCWQTSSPINLPYIKQFITKPIHTLPYWIDTKKFHALPFSKRRAVRTKYRLPQDKTIIGSFQRDTERDLVTPKLEKGPDVFCDIVEQLDRDKIFILLTGPRRDYVENRLTAKNIPYYSLGQVPYNAMNDLYNTLNYYLVTSRHEGGPQAILEAMATRTRIFSTRVGVADLLSSQVTFSNAEQCAALLTGPYPDVLKQHQYKAASLNCQNVIPQFEQFFKRLIQEYAPAHTIPV